MFKKTIKVFAILIGIIALCISLLIHLKVIWLLAPNYQVAEYIRLEVPIMDMKAYENIWDYHRRPYCYAVQASSGKKVQVVGVDHTKNPENPQLDTIQNLWKQNRPDLALVEGKVGNLFTWLQHPVVELGEGGLVTHLANETGIPLYSWEPSKTTEISILLKDFSVEQVAMFYIIRPYFSNIRYGRPDNPEAKLQEYISTRIDIKPLKGVFKSWQEVDAQWQQDFPNYDWRNHKVGSGFPEGYLHDIWNRSNIIRDEYMIQIILESLKKGKDVFVVMGVSHAPRIEATLRKVMEAI